MLGTELKLRTCAASLEPNPGRGRPRKGRRDNTNERL